MTEESSDMLCVPEASVSNVEGVDDGADDVIAGSIDPAEYLKRKPKKSILKSSTSVDKPSARDISPKRAEHAQFDEMNIIATLHPADKDYGHMKIEEPKTPYHYDSGEEGDSGPEGRVRRVSLTEKPYSVDVDVLSDKLLSCDDEKKHVPGYSSSSDEETEDENKKAKKNAFKLKRKQHYNEGLHLKMAKELLKNDLADNGDVGDEVGGDIELAQKNAQQQVAMMETT